MRRVVLPQLQPGERIGEIQARALDGGGLLHLYRPQGGVAAACGRTGRPENRLSEIPFRLPAAPFACRFRRIVLPFGEGFNRAPKQRLDRARYRPVLAALRRVPDGEGATVLARILDLDPGRAPPAA
jgi:hypothetical protein